MQQILVNNGKRIIITCFSICFCRKARAADSLSKYTSLLILSNTRPTLNIRSSFSSSSLAVISCSDDSSAIGVSTLASASLAYAASKVSPCVRTWFRQSTGLALPPWTVSVWTLGLFIAWRGRREIQRFWCWDMNMEVLRILLYGDEIVL